MARLISLRSHLVLLVALASVLSLSVGCKKAADEGSEAAQSEQSAEQQEAPFFVGTWVIDVSETLNPDELPEDERAVAEAMLRELQMTAIFEADGSGRITSEVMGEVGEEGFSWEIVEELDEGAFRVSLLSPDQPEADVVTIAPLEGDGFTITEGGERLAFRPAGD